MSWISVDDDGYILEWNDLPPITRQEHFGEEVVHKHTWAGEEGTAGQEYWYCTKCGTIKDREFG